MLYSGQMSKQRFHALSTEIVALGPIRVELEWDPEAECYVTEVPTLNHISTFGSTPEDAIEKTKECIRLFLESMKGNGLSLPISPQEEKELLRAIR